VQQAECPWQFPRGLVRRALGLDTLPPQIRGGHIVLARA